MTFEEGLKTIDRSYFSFRDSIQNIGSRTDYVQLYPYLFHLYRISELNNTDYDLEWLDYSDKKDALTIIGFNLCCDFTKDERAKIDDAKEHTIEYILKDISTEWFDSYYPKAFDHILRRVAQDSKGLFMQPEEVTDFVCSLCNYINDDEGYETIYNPFTGLGSYIIGGKIKRTTGDVIITYSDGKTVKTKEDSIAIGQEIDIRTYSLAHLRNMAYGDKHNIIDNYDSLFWTYEDNDEDWQGFIDNEMLYDDSIPSGDFHFTHDLIVSTPPFGVTVPRNRQYVYCDGKVYSEEESHPFPYPNITVEEEFIRRGLASICKKGKLVGLFSYGTINGYSSSCRDIKQYAIEDDLLEYVISLPAGIMPGTSIPTVVLVFNRNKKNTGKICFVDGSGFISGEKNNRLLDSSGLMSALKSGEKKISCAIPNEVVLKNDCRLNPAFYIGESNLTVPDGFDKITIGDIFDVIPGRRVEPHLIQSGRIVRMQNLSDGIYEWHKDVNSFPVDSTDRNMREITEPVVLLPKLISLRKPTYVEASVDSPIYVTPNIMALRQRSSQIDTSYLIYALQNKMSCNSAGYVTINKNELLQSSIAVPKSLSVQKEIVENAMLQSLSTRIKDAGLEAAITAQKKDFYDNLHRRKHDLCNYIGPIRSNVSAIQKFIDKHPYKDDIISNKLGITLSAYVQHLIEMVDKMSVQLEHLADEEVFGKAEPLDIYGVLKNCKGDSLYEIEFLPDTGSLGSENSEDGAAAVSFIAREDFDRIVDNIVTNASKHGFTDKSRTYTIRITLTLSIEDNQFVIKFFNNGSPMPEGIDTRRYGIKGESAGSHKGSGLGGSVVKSIVEHYNGSYEVSNDPDGLFPVCITIKLPRYE